MTRISSTILIFVKDPVPGQVKTRLGAELGMAAAAQAYRRLAERVLENLPAAEPLRVCFAPQHAEESIRAWLAPRVPAGTTFHPQCEGDLGARMAQAFGAAFADGCARVAIIGSDCIEIDPRMFATAFAALDQTDAVIGPSEDGGFYLLALKREEPALFTAIEWSTSRTRAELIARLESLGLTHQSLSPRADVDTVVEWRRAEVLLAAPRDSGIRGN